MGPAVAVQDQISKQQGAIHTVCSRSVVYSLHEPGCHTCGEVGCRDGDFRAGAWGLPRQRDACNSPAGMTCMEPCSHPLPPSALHSACARGGTPGTSTQACWRLPTEHTPPQRSRSHAEPGMYRTSVSKVVEVLYRQCVPAS